MADTLEVIGNTANRLDVTGSGSITQLTAQGTTAATGSRGPAGPPGVKGADGADGQGVPTGGTLGQVLAKTSPNNYDTGWVDQSPGATYNVTTRTSAQAGLSNSGRQALTGTLNGTNQVFTVPEGVYTAGSLDVYVNGILQVPGDAVTETSPTTGSFTLSTAPDSDDQLYVRYNDGTIDTVAGGDNGASQAYVQGLLNSTLADYATDADVLQSIADRPTTNQLGNAIDQKLVAYDANVATKITGGNHTNYLSPTLPSGQATDWAQIGQIYANASGSLWFQDATVAAQPTTTPASTMTYDNRADILLAQVGFKNVYLNADSVPITTGGTGDVLSGSRSFGQAMTMAVVARDQTMYNNVRDAAINKIQRKNTFSGQTTILNCFARQYDVTTNATTDWGVDAGDQLAILGAVIRAWNLWASAKDRDLASGLCYDIKNYLVNTDEGRAYLVMDDTQKQVPNGHHLTGGNAIWANDLSGINPVIFRMAKTFTGDTIFDQLVAGFYDLLAKTTANNGALATAKALPPHYAAYQPSSHAVFQIQSGFMGWTTTLTTNLDSAAMRVITHLYEDYKIFNEARALAYLQGPILTFFKGLYDTNSVINLSYDHTGVSQTALEDAYTYRVMYLLLSMATSGTTATTMKSAKIPYPTAVDTNGNHYFNNQIKSATASSSRDGDISCWLSESAVQGIYQDLALYGSTPNTGTTSPSGTTPVTQPGGTVVTPPASSGVTVGSFYAHGAAPSLTQSQRQTIAVGEYTKFKNLCFVNYHSNPDGSNQQTLPNGQWRVIDPNGSTPGGVNACVSEGIGYGMLATVFYGNPTLPTGVKDTNAQTMFDGFWAYYQRYQNSHGLMNWCIKSDGTVQGTGGATDGDLDAAFALVMAHRIWGSGSTGHPNYGQAAVSLINAIRNYEIVPTSGHPNPNYLTNGDQWGFDNSTYFPDYFRAGWMREFYVHTGDTRWLDIINANYPVALGSFYSGTGNAKNVNGLMTDIDRTGNRINNPILGYNNVRYPWAIAADFVWNGANTNSLSYNMLNLMVTRAKVVYGTNPVAPIATGQTINPYSGTSGICAEPAIDYSYWNGLYRNSTYVQAYGVAGIVDSAHSGWAAACMTWLSNDTEQNYFGRSLSCMSTMLMAGIMAPATPATPGTTTVTPGTSTNTNVTPVVVLGTPSNAPVGKYDLYANPNSSVAQYTATLSSGTKKDRFTWQSAVPMAFWSGIDWDSDCSAAKAVVDGAAAQNRMAQVLSYSIPGRDLGQYSAGGASNRSAYQAWVVQLATAIGTRRTVLAFEPDSLPQSTSLPDDQRTGRYSMMTYAIQYLKSHCPNLYLYVDIGHSAWLDVTTAANLLHQVAIENADGFCLNVSNFRPDSETITYGQQVCAALNLPNAHFIYDSGRNGGTPPPSWQYANPPHRQFGKLPQFGNTGIDKCDGWLWLKTPGESDGNSGDGAPSAGTLWPTYLYNDSVSDNVFTDAVSTSSGMLQLPPTPGVVTQGAQNPTY